MRTQTTDLASICKVIELYINSVKQGDLEVLRQIFHPQASIFGYMGQELFITRLAGHYDAIGNTTPPAQGEAANEQYICMVTSIAVFGNVASVEMVIASHYERDFMDCFQLLKVDGRWWIVSRVFHADPLGE